MKALSVKRVWGEETKKRKNIVIGGKEYAIHVTHNNEIAITDPLDYEKIYCIQSTEFYRNLCRETF